MRWPWQRPEAAGPPIKVQIEIKAEPPKEPPKPAHGLTRSEVQFLRDIRNLRGRVGEVDACWNWTGLIRRGLIVVHVDVTDEGRDIIDAEDRR